MAKLTVTSCLDAGHVRLAELGGALTAALALENQVEVARLVESILHLRLALERAAELPEDSHEQADLLAHLCETYGLAAALTDPLLRAQLPAVPTEGLTLTRRLLRVNGKLLRVNGKLLVVGATLSPSA